LGNPHPSTPYGVGKTLRSCFFRIRKLNWVSGALRGISLQKLAEGLGINKLPASRFTSRWTELEERKHNLQNSFDEIFVRFLGWSSITDKTKHQLRDGQTQQGECLVVEKCHCCVGSPFRKFFSEICRSSFLTLFS